jgi:hypothetical protein
MRLGENISEYYLAITVINQYKEEGKIKKI